MLRGRCRIQTYLYDDPDHPHRPSGVIESPAYTDDDRSLLLALQAHEDSLCRCGEPKSQVWHSDIDGWLESVDFVCHGCTALNDGKQVVYHSLRFLDGELPTLTPLEIGVNTTPPTTDT